MTPKPITKHLGSFENEETTDDEETSNASGSEDESESEPEPMPEFLAPNRERRANAGSKMAALISSSAHADEFYESAYGGNFLEDDIDDNFASPPESGAENDDEVDSDFDQPEDDDEPMPDNEEAIILGERNEKRIKKQKEFEKNRLSNLARQSNVAENVCDARTQQLRLKEAKLTEIENTESLQKYQEIELERKKRQVKPVLKRRFDGPRIRSLETAAAIEWTFPSIHKFHRPQQREYHVCAVTGRPAKYIDPLTELPYSDVDAFKTIRNSYKEFLQKNPNLLM